MPSSSVRKRKKTGPSVKARVGAHRERLRAQGLRPIQIWVPDTRTPGFAKEVRRQCRMIARSAQDADDQAFVDSISWFNSDAAR